MDFIKTHLPCEECGSSDALSLNADGSTKCFACGEFKPNNTITPSMPTAPNNTSAPLPKPQAPPAPAGGAPKPPMGVMPPMGGAPAGGMGMPPKKPPMPMMKAGGKVKKKAKSKSYGKGGKVRGCGIAKKGVRPAKMR